MRHDWNTHGVLYHPIHLFPLADRRSYRLTFWVDDHELYFVVHGGANLDRALNRFDELQISCTIKEVPYESV